MLSAFAQQVPEPPKPALADDPAARQLVRQIIANELRAEKADHTHWMYLDRMKEPGKDVVKEVVQSNSANLELLTARNGRPITEAERRKELQRLQKLTTDPNAQREQWREEREDAEKAQRMLQMLPEAFRYRIASRDGNRVTLSFVPDPQFRPASREATVFHAMAGTMVLDTQQQRLVVMTGRLIDDVKFGFGILGHLDKGGSFLVRQQEVDPGCWQISELDVQMTGKALFFKSINLHQQEWRTQFRRLPDSLSAAQGLAVLANQANTLAQK